MKECNKHGGGEGYGNGTTSIKVLFIWYGIKTAGMDGELGLVLVWE